MSDSNLAAFVLQKKPKKRKEGEQKAERKNEETDDFEAALEREVKKEAVDTERPLKRIRKKGSGSLAI